MLEHLPYTHTHIHSSGLEMVKLCCKNTFSFNNRFFLLCCYSGEATADELLSRLQHVKEGQEQQNTAPSNDRGEEPIGKIVSFAINFEFQT